MDIPYWEKKKKEKGGSLWQQQDGRQWERLETSSNFALSLTDQPQELTTEPNSNAIYFFVTEMGIN